MGWSGSLYIPLALVLGVGCLEMVDHNPGDACDSWLVGNTWAGGYEAHLVFTVDHDVDRWEVDITFDKEITSLTCWMADWETSDQVTFKLTNLAWDGDYDDGDTMNILLHVNYDKDAQDLPDMIFATFDGSLICGDGPMPTTTEASTQPTQQTTNRETTPTSESSTQPSHPTQPTRQTTTSKPSSTTTTATENDCSAIFSIETEDVGSWHGLVTLTAETHVKGWEVKMTFTERIDNLESPLAVVSGGGKQWTLSSKSFDDDLEVGTVLELRFEVYYSDNSPDVINIEFNGDELCEEGTPSSTTNSQPGEDCSDAYAVESEDAGSWHGLIDVIVPEDIVGWKLVLGFDSNVDSLQTPLGVVTGSGKDWIISNQDFDGELSEGDDLQFRFKVNYSGKNPAIIHISFNEDFLCKMD